MIRWRMVPILPSGKSDVMSRFQFCILHKWIYSSVLFFQISKKKKKVLAISVQISPSLFSFKQAQYIPFSILLTGRKDLEFFNHKLFHLITSQPLKCTVHQWVNAMGTWLSDYIKKKKRFEEAVMVFKEDSEILDEVVLSWICW